MKYMILGGGGVFGNLCARHLLSKGHEVIAIGRSPLKPHFHLGVGKSNPAYEYHQIHIAQETAELLRMMDDRRPDYVVNFAALAYANSWDNPAPYYRTNTLAVVDIVQWLSGRSWLRKFIQIGSSEVYGSTPAPAAEDAPLNPSSPYAVSKLAADLHLLTMRDYLPLCVLRPSNCYGEGQYAYRIIPKTILYLLSGMTFPLEGGGVAEKSFMHADDLATAIEVVAEKGDAPLYNVGVDTPISMRALVEEICKQMRKPFSEHVYAVPGRQTEDSRYWIDSSRIKALGWLPGVGMEEGIARMIAWCTQHKDALSQEATKFTLRA